MMIIISDERIMMWMVHNNLSSFALVHALLLQSLEKMNRSILSGKENITMYSMPFIMNSS